jgi:hypothetical protein
MGQEGPAVKEYRAWTAMKQRCLNPAGVNFHRYGGRGIRVCAEWLTSFDAFYRDMGPAPSPGHSVDRIDNDGNYEPRNCRWATSAEQARNKSTNRLLTLNGETLTASDWSRRTGISIGAISYRLDHLKMTTAQALTTPADPSSRGRLSWVSRRETMKRYRRWDANNCGPDCDLAERG